MAIALRALGATLLAALVVALATGCGTETVGVEEIARAADLSERTSGVKVAVEATIHGPQGEVPMTGSGVMDMRGQQVAFNYEFQDQRMEQVADGLTMYFKGGPFTADLEDGKEWAKLDLARANRELGIDLGAVQQPGGGDPRQMFSQLKGVSGEVEKVGEEEVRGVETTHYRGEVDLLRIAESVPRRRREAARTSMERAVEQFGLENYPVDVWIGEDDLVQRIRMEPSMEILGQAISFEMTMEFYDYGTPVSIDPPPADRVQDVTERASDAAGMLGASSQ
jgi:hypothetical protein